MEITNCKVNAATNYEDDVEMVVKLRLNHKYRQFSMKRFLS